MGYSNTPEAERNNLPSILFDKSYRTYGQLSSFSDLPEVSTRLALDAGSASNLNLARTIGNLLRSQLFAIAVARLTVVS
jgi:hypothetical protein